MARRDNPALELIRLQDELTATPGWVQLQFLRSLERSARILHENAAELRAPLRFWADPRQSLRLRAVENRHELGEFQEELDRLLLNFVASTKSLVDHTRIIINESVPDDEGYQAEVVRLFGDGSAVFVQNLRNYVLHVGLAPQFLRSTHSREEFTGQMVLDRERLKSWSRWPAAARTWLEGQSDDIDVLALLDDYEARVIALSSWLDARIRSVHREALAVTQDLAREHDELLAATFPETRPRQG